jgi:hypothetical protein
MIKSDEEATLRQILVWKSDNSGAGRRPGPVPEAPRKGTFYPVGPGARSNT